MWVKHKQHHGFTIVELLIVIVVIAILAAISIVAYNGVQTRARASAASSALSQASKKIALAQVDDASVPTCAAFYTLITSKTDSTSCSFTSGDVDYQYSRIPAANPTGYCITSTISKTSYYLSNTGVPQTGGCAGHGSGGAPAITNFATNPSVETNSLGWSSLAGTGGAVTQARTSGTAFSGTYFYRQTWTTAPSGGNVSLQSAATYNPISENRNYAFSVRGRVSWPNTNLALNVVWYDAQGGVMTSFTGTSISTAINEWTTVTSTGLSPTGAANARIILMATNAVPSVGSTFDVDGLMIVEGTSHYNYADGNSSSWLWNGGINTSSSTGPAS